MVIYLTFISYTFFVKNKEKEKILKGVRKKK